MNFSLALDILLAVLLVATIGYAMVLNRKLGNLRRHKEELEGLAATFSQSTARANDSIARLKNSTAGLQTDTAKAAGLKDDLKFLIDRGTSAADRLEAAVRESRAESETKGRAGPGKPQHPIETVDESIATAAGSPHMENRGNNDDSVRAGFPSEAEENGDGARSQAERELIEALRLVR